MAKTNPNNVPCSKAEAERMADESFHRAIACTMSTVAETDRLSIEEIQTLWDKINATADKVTKGIWSLPAIVEYLEKRFNIHIGRIQSAKCNTIGRAKKNAKTSFRLACAIMLSEIVETKKFSDDEIRALWERILYKSDSIKRGYVKLTEVCQALEDEYGITVGGVLVDN